MTNPDNRPERITVTPGTVGEWREALEPNIQRFRVASAMKMQAVWNPDGSAAMAELLEHMCGLLDAAVEAIATSDAANARIAELTEVLTWASWQISRPTRRTKHNGSYVDGYERMQAALSETTAGKEAGDDAPQQS
jgi:hypothetical protein